MTWVIGYLEYLDWSMEGKRMECTMNSVRHTHIGCNVIGVTEEERMRVGRNEGAISEQVKAKNYSELMKNSNLPIYEALRTLSG